MPQHLCNCGTEYYADRRRQGSKNQKQVVLPAGQLTGRRHRTDVASLSFE